MKKKTPKKLQENQNNKGGAPNLNRTTKTPKRTNLENKNLRIDRIKANVEIAATPYTARDNDSGKRPKD